MYVFIKYIMDVDTYGNISMIQDRIYGSWFMVHGSWLMRQHWPGVGAVSSQRVQIDAEMLLFG